MRTLAIIGLAGLLLFFGYRAFNYTGAEVVNHSEPQLIEVIIEEVEE